MLTRTPGTTLVAILLCAVVGCGSEVVGKVSAAEPTTAAVATPAVKATVKSIGKIDKPLTRQTQPRSISIDTPLPQAAIAPAPSYTPTAIPGENRAVVETAVPVVVASPTAVSVVTPKASAANTAAMSGTVARRVAASQGLASYTVALSVSDRYRITGDISVDDTRSVRLFGKGRQPGYVRYNLDWRDLKGRGVRFGSTVPVVDEGFPDLAKRIGVIVVPKRASAGTLTDRLMGRKKERGRRNLYSIDLVQVPLPSKESFGGKSKAFGGRLDFDYETGTWTPNGLHLVYGAEGREDKRDEISGSIKCISRESGHRVCDLNLRFNAEPQRSMGEEAYFEGEADESAFFLDDSGVTSVGGNIVERDSQNGADGVASYNLRLNGMTEEQIAAFVKLWLIIQGSMSDAFGS